MKLQFKHQKFQADAAKAVVDVFAGQPYLTPSYMMDRGSGTYQQSTTEDLDYTLMNYNTHHSYYFHPT